MVKQTISKLWGEPAMCITPNWQYLSPKSWTKGDVRFNNSHHRVAAPSSPLAFKRHHPLTSFTNHHPYTTTV